MIHMGIDPGCAYTGVALWNTANDVYVAAYRGDDRVQLAKRIEERAVFEPNTRVTIEQAGLRGGGLGQVRAGGALVNRALGEFLAGWLSRAGLDVRLVSPARWKSNLPKDVMHARMERDYPDVVQSLPEAGKKDALDALGIALWSARNV